MDAKIIQNEIKKLDKKGFPIRRLLSSEEVSDVVEKHLEDIIASDPELIGKSLKLESGYWLQKVTGLKSVGCVLFFVKESFI
jgi:hypothetical protein